MTRKKFFSFNVRGVHNFLFKFNILKYEVNGLKIINLLIVVNGLGLS